MTPEEFQPGRWTETSLLHTPTLEAALSDQAQTLTLRFASGHEETIERGDIEALTRYLSENAQVAPLKVDEDVFKDFVPRQVI